MASQLGVTPSAISHSMPQLEERLGARLLNRSTRNVAVILCRLAVARSAAAGD